MDRVPLKLGIAACFLFLLSLALPAAELSILDRPSLILGWEAALLSISLSTWPISDPGAFVLSLAALGNVVFLIAPWMIFKRSAAYALAVLVAFALAIASFFVLDNAPGLHGGYFAWLMAYALLVGASTMRAAAR